MRTDKTTVIVKKYGNRRLYDTNESRYVTLDEVAAIVRRGDDVEVLDASTNADLTQPTLIQIIVESGGAERLLPAPLLMQLIRMHDTAVAALMGQWLSQALEVYLTGQGVADAISPFVPTASAPFAATNAFARMMMAGFGVPGGFGFPGFTAPAPAPSKAAAAPAPEPPPGPLEDDIAALRKELAALRRDLLHPPAEPAARPARPRRRRSS